MPGTAQRRPSRESLHEVCGLESASKRARFTPQDAQPDSFEIIDSDSDSEMTRVLEQQRLATVQAQAEAAGKPGKLVDVTCVVCMEEMVNVTATHCGHLFCHTCLMEALIAGENQAAEPGKGHSRCPICRKKVKRSVGRSGKPEVIPLEIKVKVRPSITLGKGKRKVQSTAS